jgi:hypothetical protein
VFASLRDIASKMLEKLAVRVGGKLADTSYLVTHPEEPDVGLPEGTPVVIFSARALEMRGEARAQRAARLEASKPAPPPGPRHGSKEWRTQQARAAK